MRENENTQSCHIAKSRQQQQQRTSLLDRAWRISTATTTREAAAAAAGELLDQGAGQGKGTGVDTL